MNGKWAVITGASSGIGKALAFEFAAGGFNLFLTGRNESVLAEVAAECAEKYRIDAETISCDLSRIEDIDRLVGIIESSSDRRQYEVLVNNAGFGIHGEFVSVDVDQNIQLINVQLAAALKLVKAVLPGMLARRSGRILNVASVYSFSPVPFQSVYSACKAFLLSFSSSVRNELKGTGVTITVFCPGTTQTEFRARAGIGQKRTHAGMTAAEAAHVAYTATLRGKHIVVPGLLNNLFVLFAQILPSDIVPGIVRFINRQRGQAQ